MVKYSVETLTGEHVNITRLGKRLEGGQFAVIYRSGSTLRTRPEDVITGKTRQMDAADEKYALCRNT